MSICTYAIDTLPLVSKLSSECVYSTSADDATASEWVDYLRGGWDDHMHGHQFGYTFTMQDTLRGDVVNI